MRQNPLIDLDFLYTLHEPLGGLTALGDKREIGVEAPLLIVLYPIASETPDGDVLGQIRRTGKAVFWPCYEGGEDRLYIMGMEVEEARRIAHRPYHPPPLRGGPSRYQAAQEAWGNTYAPYGRPDGAPPPEAVPMLRMSLERSGQNLARGAVDGEPVDAWPGIPKLVQRVGSPEASPYGWLGNLHKLLVLTPPSQDREDAIAWLLAQNSSFEDLRFCWTLCPVLLDYPQVKAWADAIYLRDMGSVRPTRMPASCKYLPRYNDRTGYMAPVPEPLATKRREAREAREVVGQKIREDLDRKHAEALAAARVAEAK